MSPSPAMLFSFADGEPPTEKGRAQCFSREAASDLENPFRRRLDLLEDIHESENLLRPLVPLRELRGSAPAAPWWHYGGTVLLGSLLVGAGILPPARMETDEPRGLTVFLGCGGEQRVRQASSILRCPADGCLLLPAEPFIWEGSLVSFLVFQLEPERFLRTAMAMLGLVQPPAHWQDAIRHPRVWCASSGAHEAPLLALLRQELALAEQLGEAGGVLAERLHVDDRIHRLMAALLLPEVCEASPHDRLKEKERRSRDAFDELIDFIRANLSEPLNLTLLERRSHYSRRALQYAFQERLGCTPTQWIRGQRLDQARQRLQQPEPGDCVASIAAACGYRSLSLFSVDFQQRFHVKPSHLLREARSSLVLPRR